MLQECVVGVIICSVAHRDKESCEEEVDEIIPEKVFQLEKFFDDLKGNFGNFDLFSSV